MVGVETAEYLAEKGCKVTVLEMLPEICMDLGNPRKICVNENVYAAGIVPVTGVTVKEIEDGAVIGEKDGEKVSYPCDFAVMAVGSKKRSTAALEEACYANGVAYFEIGDAAGARRALNATREGFDAALKFDDPQEHAYALRPKKVVLTLTAPVALSSEMISPSVPSSAPWMTFTLSPIA